MAININASTNNPVGANKTTKNTGSAQPLEAKSGNGTDTALSDEVVELSDRGRVMKALESSVQSLPDIDQDKVSSIRNAITNGEYEIDYDKLASAFRRFESEL